ncbi:integrase catalytic domain-containing protein [Trichonephila clavipes]|nr:integrase catalytic domain-containing protein [Trichonephila clavipes]
MLKGQIWGACIVQNRPISSNPKTAKFCDIQPIVEAVPDHLHELREKGNFIGLLYELIALKQSNRILLPTFLNIYSAVQHLRHVLEAQHCIYTDHKPITYAFLQRREKLPPVQHNQLSFIGQFTTDIQHISGAENGVADVFSRISYIVPPPEDIKAIAEAQKGDTELLHLQTSDNSLKMEKIEVPGSDVTLICDTSMPRPRPSAPASERCQVFNALHVLSLPGSHATAHLISTHFVWSRIWLSHLDSCLFTLSTLEDHQKQLLSSSDLRCFIVTISIHPY